MKLINYGKLKSIKKTRIQLEWYIYLNVHQNMKNVNNCKREKKTSVLCSNFNVIISINNNT